MSFSGLFFSSFLLVVDAEFHFFEVLNEGRVTSCSKS